MITLQNKIKFPSRIQIVWNDEKQELEVVPANVILQNKESVFYEQSVVTTVNEERHRLTAFLKFIMEKDEYGNNLLTYCGTDLCPTFEDAVKMFNSWTERKEAAEQNTSAA